ncbi:MAG: hypothetical protein KDC28_03375 [Saprospiraceae bacterium]|nr:hypothetical protein [Saprospiraceae bacterium]MCB9318852.1 hypothetical protein [Lewinellaceae bacterium]
MISVDSKYKDILLEAVEDLMYKISLELNNMKGGPLTAERKKLTNKQKTLEEVQHLIFQSDQ